MHHQSQARRLRASFRLLLVLVLCAVSAGADEVDAFVRARLQEQKLPGAVFAVMRYGDVLRADAYGFANLELGVPTTTETVFQLGSITKQFAARAILMLADEGKLRVNDPISLYISRAPASWRGITLHHLLTHTSGIPNWVGMDDFSFHSDYTEREFLAIFADRALDFAPGDRFHYSSAAYSLLTIVIEKVSGKRFGDFLAERIFAPAGMDSTRINDTTSLVPGRAQGYLIRNRKLQNAVNLRPQITASSGAVLTTIADMARYERVLLRGADLRPASEAALLRPVRLNNGQPYPYGMGWYLRHAGKVDIVYHTGTTAAGFRAAYVRHLPSGISVVFMCNASGDGVEPLPIAEGLVRIYLDRMVEASQ
ncbi:MAG: beta-lactamase family protein [Bryobacterales bacterium]|nr:beta-lactamase family protein [Bryobacterales bacterium]